MDELGLQQLPIFVLQRRAPALVTVTLALPGPTGCANPMAQALGHAAVGLAALATRVYDFVVVVVVAQVPLDSVPNPPLVFVLGHREQIAYPYLLLL